MERIKRVLLIVLTMFMCLANTGTVFADDSVQESDGPETTYSALYEFVLQEEGDLPEEVLSLLPETVTGLVPGDVVSNKGYEDVKVGDLVYTFVGWSPAEHTITDSDVRFTGIWKVIKPVVEEVPANEESAEYPVRFFFTKLGELTPAEDLPQEIMKLLPSTKYVSSYENVDSEIDLPSYEITAGYQFLGWAKTGNVSYEGQIEYISYFGVWDRIRFRVLPGTYPGDGVFDIRIVSSSVENHVPIMTADIGPVFCVTPEITGYPLPGTGYKAAGSISSTLANIGWNAYRTAGHYAAQVAVWNHDMSYYDDNYECSGTRYETYHDPDGSAIQDIASFACEFAPKPGKLNLKKVSSDSNYAYSDYTNNYSLGGAVYGVYSDAACTNQVATLTTNASGNSNTLEFDNDVNLYVKEITASKGFKLDDTIYPVRVRQGQTATVTSKEDPYNDPITILLTKQNAKDPSRVKYLDEAEFTVKYYDTQEDDVSGLSAKKTWVFKPSYVEEGVARVRLDQEHYVRGDSLPTNEAGMFYLPLGTFTIQETKAPQTYQIDPNVYVGHIYREDGETKAVINGGEYLEVENENLTQSEREVILSTTAIFEENGEHRYVADGVAHIVDVVEYDYLVPGKTYKLKAKLMQIEVTEVLWTQEDCDNGLCTEEQVGTVKEKAKTETGLVMEAETTFVPETESGTAEVRFDGIDFDDKANTDYVVYEYLYVCETETTVDEETGEETTTIVGEEQVTYHEDINDEGQTVHVDELYRAAFVLYKISEGNKNHKLSGAYFTVTTHRVKRDGREVDKDLGVYVTGGIYIPSENDAPFTVKLYEVPKGTVDPETGEETPPASTEPVLKGEYESETNKVTKKEAVTILGLEDGTYYTQVGDGPMQAWYIAKGTIFLPEQEEDTEITFTEIAAPTGYVKDGKPFTMTVGHDYTVERVENYRSNYFPYVPVTGRDN